MASLFQDEFLNGLGTWALGYIPYGGADFGEVVAVADAVGDGGEDAFFTEWVVAGDRHIAAAEAARTGNHEMTARDHYLRAAVAYGTAYHPFFGSPVDPRLTSAFASQTAALETGLELGPAPATKLSIPFDGVELPGFFIPAPGRTDETRPLIILNNGYDASLTDAYFASAVAAGRRGYHCLIFDGPGQGDTLYNQGVPLRPDWETVISAVVDVALELPLVDPQAIVLNGWSLGGYLAPRAASGEPRLAACVADPAQWSLGDGFRPLAVKFGATPEEADDLGSLDQSVVDQLWEVAQSSPKMVWSIIKRGFWVNGVSNMREYLIDCERYTLDERAGDIQCPTLITAAENDPIAGDAERVYDALTCEKELIRFRATEGAGDHCEMFNRSLLNNRTFDWLDEVLGAPARS
ncbi:MAG: alpha/beta fold hydrolase [Actinomycetota bacterium]|nr:alpha/beta fold hydrolase [Actinomycetota bacterium]